MHKKTFFKTYGVALLLFACSVLCYSQSKENIPLEVVQPNITVIADTTLSKDGYTTNLSVSDFECKEKARRMPTEPVKPNLPCVNLQKESIMLFPTDYLWGGYSEWDLHEGFNASLSMSVTGGIGKNRFPGVGFGTSLATMYAHQLTDRFSLAAGISASHLSWNGRNYNDIGLSVVAGYKLSQHVSLYAYGNKSLTGNFKPLYMYPVSSPDKFGGLIHVKVNQLFSFSVSIEERSYPQW